MISLLGYTVSFIQSFMTIFPVIVVGTSPPNEIVTHWDSTSRYLAYLFVAAG
jgi:hypothetical protein